MSLKVVLVETAIREDEMIETTGTVIEIATETIENDAPTEIELTEGEVTETMIEKRSVARKRMTSTIQWIHPLILTRQKVRFPLEINSLKSIFKEIGIEESLAQENQSVLPVFLRSNFSNFFHICQ